MWKIIINLYLLLFILITPLSTLASNKVYEISNELMCPVCQGQTVAESNSGLAISMREVVKRQVSEGKSKKEILNYFVNIYGDTILATPPVKGFGIILDTKTFHQEGFFKAGKSETKISFEIKIN